VTRTGKPFSIERADLRRFFEDNPGVHLVPRRPLHRIDVVLGFLASRP
jgi:hypothetical protein